MLKTRSCFVEPGRKSERKTSLVQWQANNREVLAAISRCRCLPAGPVCLRVSAVCCRPRVGLSDRLAVLVSSVSGPLSEVFSFFFLFFFFFSFFLFSLYKLANVSQGTLASALSGSSSSDSSAEPRRPEHCWWVLFVYALRKPTYFFCFDVEEWGCPVVFWCVTLAVVLGLSGSRWPWLRASPL